MKKTKQPILQSTNPMTNEVLFETTISSKNEIDKAIEQAKSALHEWSFLSIEEREQFLLSYQRQLQEKKERLAEIISKETGKPLWESKTEINAMIGKITISIEAQKLRCPTINKAIRHVTSITRHKPLGVIAILGPFNFPGHLPNGHIIPALLAGNTVVFKPSEYTPWVGHELIKLWEECGLPKGVVNIVQGEKETGKALSLHPSVAAVLFTGSRVTGRTIAKQLAHYPEKLLALEMGGNNPLIIGNINNLEAAAYLTIQSAFLTSGQRCTAARRVIVPKNSTGDAYLQTVKNMLDHIFIGAYTDLPEPFMGPVITEKIAKQLLKTWNELKKLGGVPLKEMKRLDKYAPLLSPGIIDVTAILSRKDEEYFGPLLQLIRTDNLEHSIKEANNTSFGLSAAIFSEDKKEYELFYKQSQAGIINWNTPTTGASSSAPFGGVGQSGNWRPSAFYAADYCNYPVASMETAILALPDVITPGVKIQKEGT